MSLVLTIRHRQHSRKVDSRFLRQIVHSLLKEYLHLSEAELGISTVAAPEMTRLNRTFLRHAGSTDVITFDYSDLPKRQTLDPAPEIHGEIFICMDDAVAHARRFRTTWQSELVRYVVHGVLHLLGHDDRRAANRRKMKREENRLLRLLAKRFPFGKLAA